MPVPATRDAACVTGRPRPLLPSLALPYIALFALVGLLASCGPTDRLAQRERAPRQTHPRTVPADKAPLFPGLRKKSKRRAVAASRPGERRPFSRGTYAQSEAVLRKRNRGRTEPSVTRDGAVAETEHDAPAATPPTTELATEEGAGRKRDAARHERRLRADIEDAAASYTGIPYAYGGTTTEGFDCSGFTQYVMRDFGIALKRVSISQAKQGRAVKPKHAEPGDLVYFANERGRVNHVGIVVSNSSGGLVMIHASSSRGIRRDNVTHSEYWGPRLAGARCVVECRAPTGLRAKGPGVASN